MRLQLLFKNTEEKNTTLSQVNIYLSEVNFVIFSQDDNLFESSINFFGSRVKYSIVLFIDLIQGMTPLELKTQEYIVIYKNLHNFNLNIVIMIIRSLK